MRRFTIRSSLIAGLLLITGLALVPSAVTACSSRVDTTMRQLKLLARTLSEYKTKCGRYPTTEQGLEALVHDPISDPRCIEYEKDGFIKGGRVPKDAWGEDFVYQSDGSSFELLSLGEDQLPGGHRRGRDIIIHDQGMPTLSPDETLSLFERLKERFGLNIPIIPALMVAVGILGIIMALRALIRGNPRGQVWPALCLLVLAILLVVDLTGIFENSC